MYALGTILYEMLTGRPPFRGETPMDTLMQVIKQEPVRPTQLQPKCPRDLETICLKCLQKEPAKRYASAGEIADDVQRFLRDRPILARPVGPAERTWRWAKRNPAVAALLSVLFAVLTVGFVVVFGLWRQAVREHRLAVGQQARARANLLKATEAVDRMLAASATSGWLTCRNSRTSGGRSWKTRSGFTTNSSNKKPTTRRCAGKWAGPTFGWETSSAAWVGATRCRDALDHAAGIQEELRRESPDDQVRRNDLARTVLAQAACMRLLNRLDLAQPLYERSLGLADALVKETPEDDDFRVTLAQTHSQLGYYWFQTRRFDLAESHYRKSLDELAALATARPNSFEHGLERGRAHGHLAFFLANIGRAAPAEASACEEIAELESLLTRFPAQAADRASVGRRPPHTGVGVGRN